MFFHKLKDSNEEKDNSEEAEESATVEETAAQAAHDTVEEWGKFLHIKDKVQLKLVCKLDIVKSND